MLYIYWWLISVSVYLSLLQYHSYLSTEIPGFQVIAALYGLEDTDDWGQCLFPQARLSFSMLCLLWWLRSSSSGHSFTPVVHHGDVVLPYLGSLLCRLPKIEIKIKYEPVWNQLQKREKNKASQQCVSNTLRIMLQGSLYKYAEQPALFMKVSMY